MKISKTQRLTNWETDKLTDAQQRYAATDAWATLLLHQQLIRMPQISTQQKLLIKQELLLEEEQKIQQKINTTKETMS